MNQAVKAGEKSKEKKEPTSELDEYEIVGTLGKGAYGKVSLARRDGRLCAMKQIEKKQLSKEKKEYQAYIQRQLLRKINHPGIIKLQKCFQDKKNLYYVLEYCHGGDLTTFIRINHMHLTNEAKVFYIAEIVSILEYLHSVGITHRDLKPENLMLSKDGHLKLIDFGTAEITKCTIIDGKFKEDIVNQKKSSKSIPETGEEDQNDAEEEEQISPRKRKSTFVGTCYYLSPELLEKDECEAPSDLWALGCILYELYYLQSPFKANTEYQVFEKIKNAQILFPKNQSISEEAVDLIKRLLVKIPQQRLGSNEKEGLMFSDLKNHPFFKGVTFENIFTQEVPEIKEEEINKADMEAKSNKLKGEVEEDLEEELENKQNIILKGVVQKRTFASYFLTYLVLFSNFKLMEASSSKPHSLKSLSITPLKEGVVAELIADDKFKIIAEECIWKIRTSNASQWVDTLNAEYSKALTEK